MKNEFKKLMKRELGESDYNKYFLFIKKNLDYKIIDRHAIFFDMFSKLENNNIELVKERQNKLNNALINALEISQNYLFVMLFYFIAMLILLYKIKSIPIIIIASAIINFAFIVKTFEYHINKYCYVDAQILIVYKAVLDKIVSSNQNKKH
ncbi:MAG TPA: hypothetical protein GXZ90_04740 [Clostridiales bacterium]|nr:hypothetical protein [Clostridiales bacterium]